MDDEIQKVKNGDITERELERAKTNARADVIRNLSSNLGLAMAVAQNQAQEGSWKTLFTDLNKIDTVTLGDLKRVANTYLVKTNRTVGLIESNASDDSVASSK
jgi:predicted Zn-dependent peptidase